MKIDENQWKRMKISENQWKSTKINENQWNSMKNQWKSIKNQYKIEFFRIHSGSIVNFDENCAFLLSFCMILHRFWRIFADFGGISMGLGWNFNKNSGFSEKK